MVDDALPEANEQLNRSITTDPIQALSSQFKFLKKKQLSSFVHILNTITKEDVDGIYVSEIEEACEAHNKEVVASFLEELHKFIVTEYAPKVSFLLSTTH